MEVKMSNYSILISKITSTYFYSISISSQIFSVLHIVIIVCFGFLQFIIDGSS